MSASPYSLTELFRSASIGAMLLAIASASMAQDVLIIQPGAPGDAARELTAEQATEIASSSYSPADTLFMQDMIPHHNQAVQMAELVAERTNLEELVDVAGRINASQADEIEFMQGWLRERSERVPDPTAHSAMHTTHKMAGMASPEQMAELAASKGTAFDKLFLSLMITHHEGAVKMVEELMEQPGSAFDTQLFKFTSDITNDQVAEIGRMNALLVSLSADPPVRRSVILNSSPRCPGHPGSSIRRIPVTCNRRCRPKMTMSQMRQERPMTTTRIRMTPNLASAIRS